MRFVDRHELMTLPEGTLYQEHHGGGNLGSPMLKGETLKGPEVELNAGTGKYEVVGEKNSDWYESSLLAETNCGNTSLVLNDDLCRAGCFDDGIRYLVYEPADVVIIITRLQEVEITEAQRESWPTLALPER